MRPEEVKGPTNINSGKTKLGRRFGRHAVAATVCAFSILLGLPGLGQDSFERAENRLWQGNVGEGFAPGAQTLSLEAGVNYGIAAFGSEQAHHLALGSLSYGHMLTRVLAENRWFRGNFEVRGELFGGTQFSPDDNWIIGLTPHLRYYFATGTPCIPFFDLGTGVTATGIGPPDLSGTFEFNLQAGLGVHWFVTENLAITLEGRYIHLSCAGISHPNHGLNGILGLIGVTRAF